MTETRDPQEFGPGYIPHSFKTAEEFRYRLEARCDTLFAPYITRAMDSQMEARQDGDLRERFLAAGLPPEAVDHVDWEAGLYLCAIAEVLGDCMHFALKRGLQIGGCWAMASEQYNRQSTAMTRYLAYQAPDDSPQGAPLNVVPGE